MQSRETSTMMCVQRNTSTDLNEEAVHDGWVSRRLQNLAVAGWRATTIRLSTSLAQIYFYEEDIIFFT
jgi:hypothetical protein